MRRVARLAEVYETLNRFLCLACRNKGQKLCLAASVEGKEKANV
jgi:hypothetical protein